MSEFYFGLWNGPVSDAWSEAAGDVAGRHDAHVIPYQDPATGPRGWFGCRNRGAPFDQATARAVLDDLVTAGLWDRDSGPVEPDPDPIGEATRAGDRALADAGVLDVGGPDWRDVLEPPAPWTVADRVRLHEGQRRRGIDEPDGWIVRDMPDGADVAAGPRARDALRLARDLGLSRRGGGDLFAWRATAAELDALAEHLPPSVLGIVEGAVPWWREPDR